MGKASKAPPSTYKRKFLVTEHAVDRLRGRLEGENTDYRTPEDVGNLIDFATSSCWEKADEIVDNGAEAHIVPLEDVLGEGLWALVKANSSQNKVEYPMAVITLLTDHQVRNSRLAGDWKVIDGGNNGGENAKKEVALSVQPLVKSQEKRAPILISWFNKRENKTVYEEYDDKNVAEERINELQDNPSYRAGSIRAWTASKVKLVLP
jgi:hypothetical protein